MPLPKLTGILNNCALHALTPEIIQEIIHFSDTDDYNNRFNAEYELLKRHFSEFYDIDQSWTWQDFSRIIKTYNALDIQIIFGPVLREYMKTKMQEDIDNTSILAAANEVVDTDDYISQITSIRDETKRYNTLSIDEVECFIGRYLGFHFELHKNSQTNKIFSIVNPIQTLEMYHTGTEPTNEHWERIDTNMLADTGNNDEQNSKLKDIISIINDVNTMKEGIDLLKKHVLATLNNDTNEINRIVITAQQIDFINQALLTIPSNRIINDIGNVQISIEAQHFLNTKKNNTPIEQFNEKQIQDTLNKFPKFSDYDTIKIVLSDFQNKLNGIGKHHQNAKNIARNLYSRLDKLTSKTFNNRNPSQEEIKIYNTQLSNLINQALPELERDLGWGDYLKNLCNKIIKILTVGYHQGFFSSKKSNVAEEVEKIRNTLQK